MTLDFPPVMPDCRSLGGGVWLTREPWEFELEGMCVEVPAGFQTDLYSAPWIVTPFIPRDQRDNRPALIHDMLYATVGMRARTTTGPVFSRQECDEALLLAMERCGFGWVRRWLIHRGVRLGGGAAWGKLARGPWTAWNPKMI